MAKMLAIGPRGAGRKSFRRLLEGINDARILCGLWGGYRYVITVRALRENRSAALLDTAAIIAAAVTLVGTVVAFALPSLR